MSNEQLIVYLMSLLDNLNTAIDKTMDNLPKELSVEIPKTFDEPVALYPVLDPILEFKENLYIQLEALQGDHKS